MQKTIVMSEFTKQYLRNIVALYRFGHSVQSTASSDEKHTAPHRNYYSERQPAKTRHTDTSSTNCKILVVWDDLSDMLELSDRTGADFPQIS